MTTSRNCLFLFFYILATIDISGQIYCPADVEVSCFSSLSLDECGNATVLSGNYHQSQIKFVDDDQTNACNEGQVFRTFYIDLDYDNTFSTNEPNCTQTITLNYNSLPLNIQFPEEVVLSCADDIPSSQPVWSHNPCDLVGYTYEDEEFEFEEGACLKVVRTFTVINWCEYELGNGQGLYTGIQIIKIIDEDAPEIEVCESQVFEAVADCETSVTLTNRATDIGNCPSGMLQWTLSVDLWADGSEDYFYGPNEPSPFRIDATANGEEVSITLPENISISKHKLVWKVTDGCGNVRSCSSDFEVVDNKPPSPYCIGFLSATLDGGHDGQLVVPVELFDLGGLDNCSSQEELRLSFSENVEDTERVIECGEIGIQFYRIYYTDGAGNQDFCEVFMLVLDNGSCAGKFEPQGRVTTRHGEYLSNVETYLMEGADIVSESVTEEDGSYSFGEQSLMDTYHAEASHEDDPLTGVDILDFQLVMEAALGKEDLDYYQRIAADLNNDGQFDFDDLILFRELLLGEVELSRDDAWVFIPYSQEANATTAIFNPKMSITNYQYGFNFWAVKKGDVTGAKNVQEFNTIESLDLSVEILNDRVVISNPNEIKTGCYTMAFNIDSKFVSTSMQEVAISDYHNKTLLSNLVNTSLELAPSELNVTLDYSFENDPSQIISTLINEVSFTANNSKSIATINWTINNLRSENKHKNEIADIKVYPTIFDDHITINAQNIEELYLNSVDGTVVEFEASISKGVTDILINRSLPNGLYFLKVVSDEGEKVFKLIK
jgi:hypothetical protein